MLLERRLPAGNLTIVYDELGNKYEIPVYCLSEPTNLIHEVRDSALLPCSDQSRFYSFRVEQPDITMSKLLVFPEAKVHALGVGGELPLVFAETTADALGNPRAAAVYALGHLLGASLPPTHCLRTWRLPSSCTLHTRRVPSRLTDCALSDVFGVSGIDVRVAAVQAGRGIA